MKAKIVSVKHYFAETENGELYNIDINNGLIKKVIDTDNFIEGEVIIKEEQCKYTDGTYARSYTETKTFVPYITETKITIDGKVHSNEKIRTIPNVPKEERSQLQEGYEPKKPKRPEIRIIPECKEPKVKHIKLK
jgi:hypothetical protein